LEPPQPFPSNAQKLILDPDSLMGVASAYRYKLSVNNPALERAAFYFDESLDVFGFNDVNKKRALKKQDWPVDAPEDHPRRYNVKIELLAGDNVIKSCGGCSMWRDRTRQPFLILTPHGSRCVEFTKNPFILLIFRCCPKFHSFAKQFTLRVEVTHHQYNVCYATELIIHRKKMNNPLKKRKLSSSENGIEGDDHDLDLDQANDIDDFFAPDEADTCYEGEEQPIENEKKKPRLLTLLDPNSATIQFSSPNLANEELEMNKYTPADLQRVLALHETLFPATVLRTNGELGTETQFAPVKSLEILTPNSYSVSSSCGAKPLKKGNSSNQPFKQFQEQFDIYNAKYEQGQIVPEQWDTPAKLKDMLWGKNKEPTTLKTLLPTPADPTVKQLDPVKPANYTVPPPIFPFKTIPETNFPEVINDEKWLSSVLDDVPFSESLFENILPFDAL